MKKYKLILTLLLLLITPLLLFAQKEEKSKSDTTKPPKTIATEIKIGDEEIRIVTKEGEKIILNKDTLELPGISIDEEGITIKDLDENGIPSWEETLEEFKGVKVSKDRVRMGKDIIIDEDEKVDGDVVSFGGDVKIKGIVTGDVVAIGGDINVTSTGKVKGDCVSIGGDLTKEKGGVIYGENVNIGPSFRGKDFFCFPFFGFFQGFAFFSKIIQIAIFIFLGIVVIAIASKSVDKVKNQIRENFLKSFLAGLLFFFILPFVFILLLITIIGIPIAIIALPLAVLIALILGYTAISLLIGEKIKENTNLKPATPMLTLIVGVIAIQLASLLGKFFGIFGGPFSPLGWILVVVGAIIVAITGITGFGAAVMTRLGTHPKEAKIVTPTPPPAPEATSPATT
jgi:uncharacterized membrane protein YccF (DUF307 family)